MDDNAELNSTFSERARETWVVRPASRSDTGSLHPRLANVREGRRKVSVLVLTEELEGKIQTALAIGCGYRSALQDAQKWKRRKLMQQADIAGTLESIRHRLSVKRSEIEPNKDPTESQKKTLETLAQNVERLKASQTILEENLATGERNLVHGLNRWRKAWTDVDKILFKVWRDAGRLVPNGDSDGDGGRSTRESGSKDEEKRKRPQPSNNRVNNLRPAMSEMAPDRQKQAERQRSEILDWRSSVESSPQGSMVDAQSPEYRQLSERANMHNSQPNRRRHQGDDHRVNRRDDEQPSPVRSHRSSMLPPPSLESRHSPSPSEGIRSGRVGPDAHQERRRDGRSRSPRREWLLSRDASRYRDRESREKKQGRARDESRRSRERNHRPEDDRGPCM